MDRRSSRHPLRKLFWKKIEETWLAGDVKTVAKMICHVHHHKTTKRDLNAVRKFMGIA